jgi:hypothetical protein
MRLYSLRDSKNVRDSKRDSAQPIEAIPIDVLNEIGQSLWSLLIKYVLDRPEWTLPSLTLMFDAWGEYGLESAQLEQMLVDRFQGHCNGKRDARRISEFLRCQSSESSRHAGLRFSGKFLLELAAACYSTSLPRGLVEEWLGLEETLAEVGADEAAAWHLALRNAADGSHVAATRSALGFTVTVPLGRGPVTVFSCGHLSASTPRDGTLGDVLKCPVCEL